MSNPQEKTIITKSGHTRYMIRAKQNFFACANCDKGIDKGDYYTFCHDCGGVFCEECVVNESFDHHDCGSEED